MSDQKSEVKNENIHVTVEKLPKARVKLHITVSPEATNAAYAKAIKSVSKEVVLPGFRKGKAPENLIIQKYTPQIKESWADTILNISFQEALTLTGLTPYRREEISLANVKGPSKEDGTSFTLEFETYPKIPKIIPQDLVLKAVETPPVTDKVVQDALENIRFHFAEWKTVEDRPAHEGDFVELDIENQDTKEFLCKDTRFLIKKGEMPNWIIHLITGLKTGESAEGVSENEKPKQHTHQHSDKCADEHCNENHDHEDDFKPTQCRITLKVIKEAILPEANDELAKKTGLKTFEDLQNRLRQDLTRQAQESAKKQLRSQVEKLLLEKYEFEIPASLVKYNQELTGEHEGEENETDVALENQLRIMFLLESITKELNLTVSDEEVLSELRYQAMSGAIDPKSLSDKDIPELQKRMKHYLLSMKAKDYIVENAQVQ